MKIKKKLLAGILLFFALMMLMPLQALAVGEVRALVVSGNDLFGHKNVCEKMAKALRDNTLPTYKTKASNIHTMYFHGTAEESGKGASVEEFKEAIGNAFRGSGSDDLNVFFYTGHGGPVGNEHLIQLNKERGITFANFAKELAKYNGKYIVIFNACCDGAMVTEGIPALAAKDQKRFSCITSTTKDDASILTLTLDLMMKGISADKNYSDLKADKNHDGMVSLSELKSYSKPTYCVGSDMILFHFEKLQLNKHAATLYTGEGYNTLTLKYTKKNSDPDIMESKNHVKWTTSDSSIATVDKNGKVTAKKAGTVKIRVKYYGTLGEYQGAGDECTITVKKPKITISQSNTAKLYAGGKKTLKATRKGTKAAIKWSSSDKTVATVNSKGVVTGKKAGTVTITAKNKDAKATYKLTVYKPTITLSPTKVELDVKDTKKLTATVKGPSKKITWTSSNKTVATVSKTGVVTAKKEGKATITAKANGVKATCQVIVEGTDYKKLYYNFLKKGEKSYTYKDGSYTRTDKAEAFYLLHLNTDKIPELVVGERDPYQSWAIFRIFTIKNNKVVYCGTCSQRGGVQISYNTKYKALHTGGWINGIGGAYDTLWRVSDAKVKSYKYTLGYYENNKQVYKQGTSSGTAKTVSASKSAAFSKQYFNKNHLKNYSLLTNNETNRVNKLLK